MKKILYVLLILGFLTIDFIFFHDIFKPGETTSFGQWLAGILSIPVIIISIQSLMKSTKNN
jgi:hypothetical protein